MTAQLDLFAFTAIEFEPSPRFEPCCPCCGDEIEVDILCGHGERLSELDWLPCCEAARDHVGAHGWDGWAGEGLVESVNRSTGDNVRAYDEGNNAPLWRLSTFAPGQGVRGWQGEVFDHIDRHHAHHDAPQGWKFGVAVHNGPTRVGVAVVGRPVSRLLAQQRPGTLEVTRVCTWGAPAARRNAASKLYGSCGKEARRLGYTQLVTYTLESEDGASLRAAGFRIEAHTRGGSWSRRGRERTDSAPTGPKLRWVRDL